MWRWCGIRSKCSPHLPFVHLFRSHLSPFPSPRSFAQTLESSSFLSPSLRVMTTKPPEEAPEALKYQVNTVSPWLYIYIYLALSTVSSFSHLLAYDSMFKILQTWVLKVSIHCEGCKKKVKKVLQSIEGGSLTILLETNITTVECLCPSVR